jgi:hypothetical protein
MPSPTICQHGVKLARCWRSPSPHLLHQLLVTLPEVQQQFRSLGLVPVISPGADELRAFVAEQTERWGKIVRQAGLAGSE